ncbi:unnamed protein product [Triticum turgidum subsp. durum]|uniref:G protein gamma domain-containing protein n=1 Tax=Triticum turgidum subsp. durum TaxID=4567 RepID=A0A9R0W7G3_TRITD|nr:unnamed protein product [Triticum turgidum subsp. durum]
MAAPRPKSPLDPCGRRRLQLAVDALHRQISFLEGEISSIEGLHAASICCKEVDEFIGKNADPFITISSEKGNADQSHRSPKKIRTRWACLSCFPWICGGGCSAVQLKGPSCCCGCPRCCVGSGGCGGGGPSCGCSCSCAGCSSSCACPACAGCGPACCGGVPRPRCCLCS